MHSSWWDIMDSCLLFVIQLTQEIKPLSSWIAQLLDSHTHTHKKNDAIGWKKYGAPFFSITVVILMQERLLRVSFPKKCEDDVIISFSHDDAILVWNEWMQKILNLWNGAQYKLTQGFFCHCWFYGWSASLQIHLDFFIF